MGKTALNKAKESFASAQDKPSADNFDTASKLAAKAVRVAAVAVIEIGKTPELQNILDEADNLDDMVDEASEKFDDQTAIANDVVNTPNRTIGESDKCNEPEGRKRSNAIHRDPRGSVGTMSHNQDWRQSSRGRRLPHHRRLPVLERLLEEIREANRRHELTK